VLLVYDITDRDSFEWVSKWKDQVAEYVGSQEAGGVVFAVVGNKVDRDADRVISVEEGQQKAREVGASIFFETSAKSGTNVSELFMAVAENAASKIPVTRDRSNLAEDKKLKINEGFGGTGNGIGGGGACDGCGGGAPSSTSNNKS
jgi:GTPase SAR1 family protein